MSADKLYEILSEGQPKGIPWEKAASQFVKMKMASGGLIPEQIEELHALVKQAQAQEHKPLTISQEEMEQAVKRGILSGASGSVRGDISRSADVRRKRGENISKNVGSVAGALGGGALGKKLVGGPAGTLGGAALGAFLGHGTGKVVGQEIDRKRIKSQGKSATIEKKSGLLQPEQPRAKDVIPGRGPEARAKRDAFRKKLRAGCPGQEKTSDFEQEKQAIFSLGDAGVASLPLAGAGIGSFMAPEGERAKGLGRGVITGTGAALGGQLGRMAGAALKANNPLMVAPAALIGGVLANRLARTILPYEREKAELQPTVIEGSEEQQPEALRYLMGQGALEQVPESEKAALRSQLPKTGEAKVRSFLMAKKASLQKRAQEEEAIPVEYLESTETPEEEEVLPPELEEFLQVQQQANEAEFFRQKAEEADARASQAEEQAEMAAAQADQTQQQADMQAQQADMQAQSTQQQAQMAQQQSQMASQDAVNARNEALSAQQQNIQMRQAFTTFRQQLMDLVAQDPTTMMPPPAVPEGPMPGAEEAAASPQEAGPPPGAEGMPPGAPGEPPGAAGAMPPPGAEMAPPGPPAPPQGPPGAPGQPPGPPMMPPAAPPMG